MESSKKRRRSVRNLRQSSTHFQAPSHILGSEEKENEAVSSTETYGSVWVEENESTRDTWATKCDSSCAGPTENGELKEASTRINQTDDSGFLVDIPDISIAWPGLEQGDEGDSNTSRSDSTKSSSTSNLVDKADILPQQRPVNERRTPTEENAEHLKSLVDVCNANVLSSKATPEVTSPKLDETFLVETGWRPITADDGNSSVCFIQPSESETSLLYSMSPNCQGQHYDSSSTHTSPPFSVFSSDTIPLARECGDASGQSQYGTSEHDPRILPSTSSLVPQTSFSSPHESRPCSNSWSPDISLKVDSSCLSESKSQSDVSAAKSATPALNNAMFSAEGSDSVRSISPDASGTESSLQQGDFANEASVGNHNGSCVHEEVDVPKNKFTEYRHDSEPGHENASMLMSSSVLGTSLSSIIEKLSEKLQVMQAINSQDVQHCADEVTQEAAPDISAAHVDSRNDIPWPPSHQQNLNQTESDKLTHGEDEKFQTCPGMEGSLSTIANKTVDEGGATENVLSTKPGSRKRSGTKNGSRLSLKKSSSIDGMVNTQCQTSSPTSKAMNSMNNEVCTEAYVESAHRKPAEDCRPQSSSYFVQPGDPQKLFSPPSRMSPCKTASAKSKKVSSAKKHPVKDTSASKITSRKGGVSGASGGSKAKTVEGKDDWKQEGAKSKKKSLKSQIGGGVKSGHTTEVIGQLEQDKLEESKVCRSSQLSSPLDVHSSPSHVNSKTTGDGEATLLSSLTVPVADSQEKAASSWQTDSTSVYDLKEGGQCQEETKQGVKKSKVRRRSSRMFSLQEVTSFSSPSKNRATSDAKTSPLSTSTASKIHQHVVETPLQIDSLLSTECLPTHNALDTDNVQFVSVCDNQENKERIENEFLEGVETLTKIDSIYNSDRSPLQNRSENIMDEVTDNFESLSVGLLSDVRKSGSKKSEISREKKKRRSSKLFKPIRDISGGNFESFDMVSSGCPSAEMSDAQPMLCQEANSDKDQAVTLNDIALLSVADEINADGKFVDEGWQSELSTSMSSLSVEENPRDECMMDAELLQLAQAGSKRRSTRVRPSRKSWHLYQASDENTTKSVKQSQCSAKKDHKNNGSEESPVYDLGHRVEVEESSFDNNIEVVSQRDLPELEFIDSELENLYRNKSYVLPESKKKWQTISENPKALRHVFSGKPSDRHILFEDRPSIHKLKQRRSKALKVLRGQPKRKMLSDKQFEKKMSQLKLLLDSVEN